MQKVSVLLASSHKGLCQSLQQVLEHEEWIQVVGTSASASDALEKAKTLSPQVIIVDYDLAGDGMEAGQKMLKNAPDAKIIILSLYDYIGRVKVEPAAEGEEPKIDAVEWLSKNSSPAELIRSISTVKRRRRIH